MSVRREVISLSQLLRRNENSNKRQGPPPLPLQISRRRSETPLSSRHKSVQERHTNAASITEKPASSRYQPLFTQYVRDANCASTSQPESSQVGTGFPVVSQEGYDAESVQLSAMTSMSQSSFSQAQSQNLLGSSQDDQLHRIQQWQTQQALPSFPPSPVRCNGNEKLQEVERNLNKAFVEQTQAQKQQQERLVTQIASPISKSMEEIKKQLVTSGEGQQKQEAVIGVLAKGIDNVTATVSELREQSRSNKATCQETRTAMVTEVAAVNVALTRLQARVDSVEGGVKVCSGHVTQVLEVIGTTHEALLSAISASSCNCPQDATQVNALSSAERATKKRRHNLSQPDLTETKTSRYVLTSIAESPTRPSAESPMQSGSLHLALQRIEALRAKRRSYLHDS